MSDVLDLSGYTEAAQSAIKFEAECWFHGHIDRAARLFDKHVEWARILTPDQRAFHRAGAWYANQLLMDAAIQQVQREMNDDTGDRVFGHKKV